MQVLLSYEQWETKKANVNVPCAHLGFLLQNVGKALITFTLSLMLSPQKMTFYIIFQPSLNAKIISEGGTHLSAGPFTLITINKIRQSVVFRSYKTSK